MKIKAIEIENLFSYGYNEDKFKIEFNEGNIAVIVGPNNAGKTNLFRVLKFLREVIEESKKHDEMVIELDKIHSTVLKNIQFYQNNPDVDSYIIVDFELTEKEKKLIEDFLRCHFGLDFEYKLDVNSNEDLSKLLDKILELLNHIKSVKSSLIGYDLLYSRLERYRLLLNQLVVSLYLLKSLSKGKLVWKYNVKSRSLYFPIYYGETEEFSIIDEKISKKIDEIKKIEEELRHKYKGIVEIIKGIIKNLEISKNKLSKEYLIKLHKHIFGFINLELIGSKNNIREYLLYDDHWGSYPTESLDFIFEDWWEKDDTLGSYENPEIKLDNIRNKSLIGIAHELKNYVKKPKSDDISLYDVIISVYYNGIISLMDTVPYPEKQFEIPDYVEYNVSKKYEIRGDSKLKHKVKEEPKDKYYREIFSLYGNNSDKLKDDKEISIPKIEEYLEKIEGLTHNIEYTENYEVSFEVKNISTISEYVGNGKDLAKYLFYLKNYHWKRFYEIKETLKLIFKQENIYDLDIFINENKFPEIRIMFKEIRNENKKDKDEDIEMDIKIFPIENVGSGIFEVLNILAVVIGAEEKVILLDEPALHLHPKYQKKLLNVLKGGFSLEENNKETKKLLENIKKRLEKNQVIIITHSPYFVNSELLPNTFRFYKDKNGKTKVVNIYTELLREVLRKEIQQMSNGQSKILNELHKLKSNELKILALQLLKIKKIKEMYEPLNFKVKNNLEKNGLSIGNLMRKFYNMEKISFEVNEYINYFLKCLLYISEVSTEYHLSICYFNYIINYVNNKMLELENIETLENEIEEEFLQNDGLIRSLFANGVILAEGDSEYLSIPILLKKLDCALDDYNIEILNVGSKTGFEKYIKLMDSLRIPCAVVCDGDTVFKNNNGKLTLNYNGNVLKVYKEIKPFWISEIDEILNNLSNSEDYEEIDKLLRTKLFIYACKEHDWTDFLINKFKDVEINGKKLKEIIEEDYGVSIEIDDNTNVKKRYKVRIKSNDGKEYKIGLWGIDNIPKNIIDDFKKYLENSQGKYELIEEEYKPKKRRDKAGIAYFIAKNVPKEYIDNIIKNENDKLAKLKQFIKNFIKECTNI
ncbi:hypothetical protein JH146_1480 [Methanocaldococcus bathoardescens]|uniref:AAA domain-containing protein n=1 Tax=Methanocaldococcus bathoardescens TaxID=1301915 RepID=A0A076LHC9_9EURY|nr:TOPRIM nucleotidyl transferase/hydrolase domain-containing protein [Methanocaldococcus bathoardescens]AIJ06322.1 hypothetical protein JH146_1480 [Methanocaldococcus bathoardescens]